MGNSLSEEMMSLALCSHDFDWKLSLRFLDVLIVGAIT